MTANILIPLDGSAQAESALPIEIALARLTSSGITLLTAVSAPATPAAQTTSEPLINDLSDAASSQEKWKEELALAREYLDSVRKRLEEVGIQVHVEIVEKPPATAIVEYTRQSPGVWLIALARSDSRPGSIYAQPWAFGSVLERVLYAAPTPILLVRPECKAKDEGWVGEGWRPAGETEGSIPAKPDIHTIIVPLDGSEYAEEALAEARHMALLTGATLVLVTVIPPANIGDIDQVEYIPISVDVARGYEARRLANYLAGIADSLRAGGLQVRTELVYGHPAEMILLTARRLHGDLIVMAAHGRRDLERLWLGSIAQKLVQGSPVPVLLIRAGRQREGAATEKEAAWGVAATPAPAQETW